MRGITVTLLQRNQIGTDAFNAPIYGSPIEIPVANVLVAPRETGGEEILSELDLTGRRSVYNLAIPKGDSHEWEGNQVRFFGQTWQVIGIPTEGIDHLIPLDWNKKVQVERIE